MEAALHEGVSLSGLDKRDGFLGRRMAVWRIDDAKPGPIRVDPGGSGRNLLLRPDKDRVNDPERCGFDGGAEGAPVTRVCHGDLQRWQRPRRGKQALDPASPPETPCGSCRP